MTKDYGPGVLRTLLVVGQDAQREAKLGNVIPENFNGVSKDIKVRPVNPDSDTVVEL